MAFVSLHIRSIKGAGLHIYDYWEHILEQKPPTAEGCAFTCPYYKGRSSDYSPDMCPNAFDLVDRAFRINVDQWWAEEDCSDVAKAINKVFGVHR